MIVKLTKTAATTEDISDYILYYSEDEFDIYPDRRKKVKFLRIKNGKYFNFQNMLTLNIWENLDALDWHKKQ